MTYQEERDRFMHEAAGAGLTCDQARRLMRHASTLQRLAVAACNGDWPCDNGERKTIACPVCGSGFAPSAIKGGPLARAAHYFGTAPDTSTPSNLRACPDCRTAAAVRAILAEDVYPPQPKLIAKFGGDPRGAVLRLYPADTPREDISNGRARGLYVPARER